MLSLPTPVLSAIALIPRALATLPTAARNTSGFSSSSAAVRYSAINSSLSRNALGSNSVTLTIAVILKFLSYFLRPRDVSGLAGLRATAQQYQDHFLLLHEVHAIASAGMDPHLSHSGADGFAVAEVS